MKELLNIQSSYLFTPNTIISQPLERALLMLAKPQILYDDPFWATNFGQVILSLRHHVILEFYHLLGKGEAVVYNNEKVGKKATAESKELFELEGRLWLRTWRALEYLDSKTAIQVYHPATVFYQLVNEYALLMCLLFHSGQSTIPAHELKKYLQSQNRKLQVMENPFEQQKVPFTFDFVQKLIRLAESDYQVYKGFLMPLVRARMTLVNRIVKSNPKSIGLNGRFDNRGRRAKKTTKMR